MFDVTRRFVQLLMDNVGSSRHGLMGEVDGFLYRLSADKLGELRADLYYLINKPEDPPEAKPAEDLELQQYDTKEGSIYVRRIPVPGGWLYTVKEETGFWTAPVFVPAPAAPEPPKPLPRPRPEPYFEPPPRRKGL